MCVSDIDISILDIFIFLFTLVQLGLCFFFNLFILICAFSGWS